MPIVTTEGFRPLRPQDASQPEITGSGRSIDLTGDAEAVALRDKLGDLDLIRIEFSNFADGRGFSLAKRLRNFGYTGHLRARGHVISDQFRYALDCGFDDVEISDDMGRRQPEAEWAFDRSKTLNYRDRLRGGAAAQGQGAPGDDGKGGAVRFAPAPAPYIAQAGVFEPRVREVRHYTDRLFSFRVTRPDSFRFRSGEFVMIGLPNAAKPVFRAYSIASPAWDDELEFYSIKVAGGPLTEHLQHIAAGDTVLVRKKATGTLVLDALTPAKRLYLFATGTGIAPFASLIRDPELYETFEQVVLTHTARHQNELTYGHAAVERANLDPLVGDMARRQLVFYPTTTRDSGRYHGRITDHIGSGALFRALELAPLDQRHDRAMICGSLPMVHETTALLEAAGLTEGANNRPGDFVVERAFVG